VENKKDPIVDAAELDTAGVWSELKADYNPTYILSRGALEAFSGEDPGDPGHCPQCRAQVVFTLSDVIGWLCPECDAAGTFSPPK